MSRYDDASDEARTLLEGFDEIDLAEMLASTQRDLAAANAALALLHEGEEPYEHAFTAATPAQWIWQWNRATPAKRLEMVDRIQQAWDRSDRCFMGGHESRLERLGAVEAANVRLRTVLDRWARYTQHPQTMRALDEVRRALTDEEQPATGGIITAGLQVVGENGSNCGTIPPLPRRDPGANAPTITINDASPGTSTLSAIAEALTAQAKQQRGPGRTTPDNPTTSADTPDNQPRTED